MSDAPVPSIRASDAERELVAQALHAAAARGQLEFGELEDRLSGVYQARTRAELVPFTADLGVDPLAVAASRPPAPAGYGDGRGRGVAIMSTVDLRGQWVVAEKYEGVAFWGQIRLDLREATFAAREVEVHASVIMGNVTIIVSEDTEVVVDGVGIVGAFENRTGPAGASVTRRLRVSGFALMGAVEVKRKSRQPRLL